MHTCGLAIFRYATPDVSGCPSNYNNTTVKFFLYIDSYNYMTSCNSVINYTSVTIIVIDHLCFESYTTIAILWANFDISTTTKMAFTPHILTVFRINLIKTVAEMSKFAKKSCFGVATCSVCTLHRTYTTSALGCLDRPPRC